MVLFWYCFRTTEVARMQLSDIISAWNTGPRGPKYQRLSAALRDAIQQGILPAGAALPPEREIAQDLGASRVTVRRALDDLALESLLIRRAGAGTFVKGQTPQTKAPLLSFSEEMARRGQQARSEWIDRYEGLATPEECLQLGGSIRERIYRLTRIRYAGRTPMAVETNVIPAYALRGAGPIEGSLYQALEKTGHRPVRAIQNVKAVLLDTEQVARLGAQEGSAGLMIERRGFLADGRTIELTQAVYRGDAYDIIMEMRGQA